MTSSTTTSFVHYVAGDVASGNIINDAGPAQPPPETDVNAKYTRDRYEPVKLSVAGLS